MFTQANARPVNRGGVIGLSLGRFAFVGAGVAAIFAGTALAGPEGAKVVRGEAKINQRGNFTRIRATDGAIINYNSFNLNANERVRFVQPSRDARVLNRIVGEAPTFINGTIKANGNVYFVNQAGITFGNSAVIDVGGLYAAAGNISNRDFINDTNHFTGVTGAVVNEGTIDTDGGVAALIGREVANRGVIMADDGVVAMVAGEDVVLQERGSNISIKIEGLAKTEGEQVQGVGVDNAGTVQAKRGRSLMVAGDMYSLAVNNTGTVRAAETRIEGRGNAAVKVGGTIDARNAAAGNRGGKVEITGQRVVLADAKINASGTNGGGTVHVGGEYQGKGELRTAETTLVSTGTEISADAVRSGDGGRIVVWADNHTGFYGKASADGGSQAGDGGFIETSGKETLDIRGGRVSATAKSDAGKNGTWLLDPRNVTIDNAVTSGGAFDAGNPDTFTPNADDAVVDVADIVSALEGGTDVQILTGNTGTQDGNITVAAGINKANGGDATLTLRAANDINVNASITSTSGELNVNLFANDGTNGNDDLDANSGSVSLGAGVMIDTFGGDLTGRGNGYAADATSAVNADAVDIDVAGGVTLGQTAAGTLSVQTTGGDITQAGVLAVAGTSSFTARNGTGGEVVLTDDANSFGGPVTLVSRTGDDSAVGDGDLNVVATGTLPVAGATTSGDVTLRADDLAITGVVRGDAGITLANRTAGTDIFVGGAGAGISLSAAELAFLDSDGSVLIGQADAGTISVGDGGAVNLSGETFSRLNLWGADVVFANTLTLPDESTAGITTVTGGIDGSNAGVDLSIGGTNGSLVIDSAGAVDLDTSIGRVAAALAAGSFTLDNTGNLRVAIIDSTSGVSVAANEDVIITSDGGLTVNFDIMTTGTGAIVLTAEGGDDGNLIVNAAIGTVDAEATLRADNDIIVNGTGSVTSTNAIARLIADFDAASTGGPFDGGSIDLNSGSTVSAGDAVVLRSGGDIDADGTLTGGSFQIEAGNDVNLRTDVAATNAMGVSILAGGTLLLDASRTISSADNPISITVRDIDLLGNINSGMGNTAIEINGAGTVGLGDATGDLTISTAEFGRITANQLSVGGTDATAVTVSGLRAAGTDNIGTVAIDATGNGGRVVFEGDGSEFRALTVNADDGIDANVSITVSEGDMVLDADADNAADTSDALNIGQGVVLSTTPMGGDIVISASNGGVVGAGAITIDANQDLVLNHDISAPGVVALFSGGTMTLGGEVMGNSVRLESDNGVTVGANITSQSGEVRILADQDEDGMGTVVVDAAATITSNGNLIEIVAGDLQLDGMIDADTGDVQISRAADGTLGLGSAAGDMQVSGDELSRISAETLSFGGTHFTTASVADVTATHTAELLEGLSISSADVDITGEFTLANGLLTIGRGMDGTIGLGTATGDMTLSNEELANISANMFMLGGDTTTSITASGVTAEATDGISGLFTMQAAETVTFSSGASTFNSLLARADELIRVNANVTTDTGDLTLNGDFDSGGDGTNGITFNANRTLSSAGQLVLQAGSGGMVAAGALTLNAAEGVQVTANLTTNGTTIINSDTDNDGGVTTVALSRAINTNSSLLSITGSDLVLEGSLNSGAGETRLLRSTAGTVGLGAATGQDMVISGAELQRIVATGLVIGGDNVTRIIVNGVTAANTASIAQGVTLEAMADNARIEITGANSVFGALTLNADNGVLVNAQLTTSIGDLVFNPNADNAQDGSDSVTLNDDVGGGNNDVRFMGGVRVGQNAIVSGRNVRFEGTVRSRTDVARSLTVNTTRNGTTTFERRVGGGDRPLAALTTNADGVTRIGANITTSGGTMTFNDGVRITSENVTLTDTGGTGIFFNSTLDAANNVTPTLSLRWLNNNLPADNALPIVSFGGNVGAVNAFENIYFNYDVTEGVDGRVNPPRIASIIARPRNSSGAIVTNPSTPFSISFNTTGEFRMGQNEKLTVGGDVTINAGTAVLGDITALGDITVNAADIQLNSRMPGTLLAPDGSIGLDLGLDYVSGGVIDFSQTPTVNGSGRVAFSTPDGTGDANGNLSSFIFQSFGDLSPSLLNRTVNSNTVTLDLRAEGPTNTNVSDAIAGAIPRETRFNDVGEDPIVGQAQIEELRQLGIVPRSLELPELLSLLVGWGLYNDYPTASDNVGTYTTAVNRLPGPEVTALLQDYDRVFNRGMVDEEGNPVLEDDGTQRRVSRASEIQESLYQSVRRFLAANPGTTSIDPVRFREYLDTTEEEAQSREYVEQLGDFLTRLEYLGLTPRELALSKNVLLAPVRPRGIATIQQFEAVIRGTEMSLTPAN